MVPVRCARPDTQQGRRGASARPVSRRHYRGADGGQTLAPSHCRRLRVAASRHLQPVARRLMV